MKKSNKQFLYLVLTFCFLMIFSSCKNEKIKSVATESDSVNTTDSIEMYNLKKTCGLATAQIITDNGMVTDISENCQHILYLKEDYPSTDETGFGSQNSLYIFDCKLNKSTKLIQSFSAEHGGGTLLDKTYEKYPFDGVGYIANAKFNTKCNLIYIEAQAWATCSAILQYDISKKTLKYFYAGGLKAIFQNDFIEVWSTDIIEGQGREELNVILDSQGNQISRRILN